MVAAPDQDASTPRRGANGTGGAAAGATRTVAAAAVAAAAAGFAASAGTNGGLAHPGTVALIVLAVAAGLAAGFALRAGRVLGAAGAGGAALCAWLLGQRNDVGTAVILAALFGLGLGASASALGRRRATAAPDRSATLVVPAAAAAGAVVAVVAAGLVASEHTMVTVTIVAALVAGALRALDPAPPSAHRARRVTFGTAFVTTVVVFAAYLGAETPSATWFGGGTTHGPTTGNEVALTFDDGPNIGATEQIMAILDAHGVKGAFFQVGKAIDAQPAITRALYADGQLLGNHSYQHDQWRWLDPRYPELARTQAAFRRAIGTCPVLYRPPHGDRTPFLARVVRDHHMHMVLWNASTPDWATDDAPAVARHILEQVRPGSIIDLHDGLDGNPTADRSVVVRALPAILDGLRAKGLHPVRLDRLLGTAAYQPC